MKEFEEQNGKLGASNTENQSDETCIVKGKMLNCPSAKKYDKKPTTWLVGAIEKGNGHIKLRIVPNRKIETLTKFFEDNIAAHREVGTDGHPSYPAALAANKNSHVIVDHTEGFKNKDGFTTNMIEGLWSILKADITTRRGILQAQIPFYIAEFCWRYKFLREKTIENTSDAFVKLMQIVFTEK